MKKTLATMMCAVSMLGLGAAAAVPGLVPIPAEMKETGGKPFLLGGQVAISADNVPEAKAASAFLADCLAKSAGIGAPRSDAKAGISFLKGDGTLGTEGYTLSVTEAGVVICADAPAGFFYGVQTLRQLLPATATFDGKPEANPSFQIPAIEIKDQPRYSWRGLHLDVCRHFVSAEEVKKILDMMASQKLNTFHWHLTEDQAWRIEIKKHPKLTEIGGWRPGIGFGLNPKDSTHTREDGKYGGFYTQEQIKDVVAYAAKLQITVVPEIELPGHAMAALVAYPELNCNPEAMKKKSMPEGGGVFRDVYCAGKEDTFKFLEDVLTETVELFPSKFIHVGGDECPKDNWKKCPACQQRMKDNGLKNEEELQSYVIRRMEKFLAGKGRRLIGWDEILEGGLAPGAAVMSWRGTQGGIHAASMGHDVVMTPGSHCYFDHYQAKQGEPKAIGGFLPFETVYQFDPMPANLPEDKRKHVLGGQANVWTEYMPNENHVEYMIAPRISAMAETLWSPKAAKNWDKFLQRMQDQYLRFDAAGFNYRRATGIGIEVTPDGVILVPETKGMPMVYTLDGTAPGKDSPVYDKPIKVEKSLQLQTRALSPNGTLGQVISRRVGPVRFLATVATTRLGQHEQNAPENVLDGNPETIYWNNREVKAGDALTVTFAQPQSPEKIRVLTGQALAGGGGDMLQKGVLEISADGKTFTQIAEFKNGVAAGEVKGPVKAIRLRATAAQNQWLVVREIEILP